MAQLLLFRQWSEHRGATRECVVLADDDADKSDDFYEEEYGSKPVSRLEVIAPSVMALAAWPTDRELSEA